MTAELYKKLIVMIVLGKWMPIKEPWFPACHCLKKKKSSFLMDITLSAVMNSLKFFIGLCLKQSVSHSGKVISYNVKILYSQLENLTSTFIYCVTGHIHNWRISHSLIFFPCLCNLFEQAVCQQWWYGLGLLIRD